MRLPSQSVLGQMFRGLLAAALFSNGAVALAASYQLSPDGNAVVRIKPGTSITSAGFDTALLTAEYPTWTVTKAAGAASGVISVDSYDAGWRSGGRGGAKINATYSQANAIAAGRSLQWVQIITTNVPLNGATSPYIDPFPNDDALPFYWNATAGDQARAAATNKSVKFDDFSTRFQSTLATTNPITWDAKLYQAEYDGATSVTVRTGVTWGWTMKPATVGNSAGTFLNPSPTCPPATCSGLGTNSVQWGLGNPGSLSFAAVAFAPNADDLFKVGTLTFHNGTTQAGSELSAVDLDIKLDFTNVAEVNKTYHTQLAITNTPNTADPQASADFVAFTSGGFTNSFRVLEQQSASADLMAKLSPKLQLVPGIASAADKDPGVPILPPTVVGYDLELVGFANPTTGGFIVAVPEPHTYATMAAGLLVLSLVYRRRTSVRPKA